jgi:putative phage-type endonuclease
MAGGTGATRKNYMMELLCQRLTGKYEDSYTSPAMLWGIENEGLARAIYELETGKEVRQTGGCPHPTIPMCGASPDGYVMEGETIIGLIEIKCPNTSSFVDFWHDDKIPRRYQLQMTWQMICTETKWCDYVCYDPRMPSNCNFKVKRFELDEKLACDITEAVVQFLKELDELEKEFRT